MGIASDWLFLTILASRIFYTTQGGFLAVVLDRPSAGKLDDWHSRCRLSLPSTIKYAAFLKRSFDEQRCRWIFAKITRPFRHALSFSCSLSKTWCSAALQENASEPSQLARSLHRLPSFCSRSSPSTLARQQGAMAWIVALRQASLWKLLTLHEQRHLFMCRVRRASCNVATAASLLSAISSNISNDFSIQSRPRLITCLTGIVALIASHLSSNIFVWMMQVTELAVDSLFVPLVCAVFLKRALSSAPSCSKNSPVFLAALALSKARFSITEALASFYPLFSQA